MGSDQMLTRRAGARIMILFREIACLCCRVPGASDAGCRVPGAGCRVPGAGAGAGASAIRTEQALSMHLQCGQCEAFGTAKAASKARVKGLVMAHLKFENSKRHTTGSGRGAHRWSRQQLWSLMRA